MSNRDENFLSRWSRLKRRGDVAGEPRRGDASPGDKAVSVDGGADAAPVRTPDKGELDAAARQIEDIAKINIEGLTYDSDFEVFMQHGVPDELRTKALRKLWTTNPVFGEIDGLDDYCEDFSDAVWATPDLQTAYKVGQGFLTDDEAAEWDALGRPAGDGTAVADASEEGALGREDAEASDAAALVEADPTGAGPDGVAVRSASAVDEPDEAMPGAKPDAPKA